MVFVEPGEVARGWLLRPVWPLLQYHVVAECDRNKSVVHIRGLSQVDVVHDEMRRRHQNMFPLLSGVE
jgi:hypothetical protein